MIIDVAVTSKSELVVDKREVLRYLGNKQNTRSLSTEIDRAIDEQIAHGYELALPKFVNATIPVHQFISASKCIDELLQQGQYIAVVICTIGNALENMVAKFFAAKRYLYGVALDATGSVLAENLADTLAHKLRQQCKQLGYRNSIRYSPGYGDWDIRGQKQLFATVDASAIGVNLNSSCLMSPLKSVSFISIIGKKIDDKHLHHRKCDLCSKDTCKFRVL